MSDSISPAAQPDYAGLFRRLDLAGVYHLSGHGHEAAVKAAHANGMYVFHVNLARARNKDELLDTLGHGMKFPEWYGHNFDALMDCLTDLGWRPAEGYLVLLEHCDGIHGRAEADFVATLQIFEQAADEWRKQGVPFWCLVDMLADGIAWLPGIA